VRLHDFLRILVLKFYILMLYRRKSSVTTFHKLKDMGLNIINLWYRYMI